MKVLVAALLLALAGSVIGRAHRKPDATLNSLWDNWKTKYEKSYDNRVEENKHRLIWEKNLRFVQEHNALYEEGHSSFKVTLNNFSDLEKAVNEHPIHHHRRSHASQTACRRPLPDEMDTDDLPASIDWRTEGYVTEVKTQLPQQCLHSIYFAVTGALEGQWYKKTGNLLNLSEQNIADCCGAGEQQCAPGTPCSIDKVYQWIRQKGLENSTEYPDTRAYQQCAFDIKKRVATCSGYDFIDANEKSLQFAVATIGPISVAIDSSQPSFQAYSGGVYNEPKCTQTTDRNLLVVGYGTDSTGGDYWIAKNSFGPEWGEKGYIRMSRNRNNQCGIANTASYPFFSCDQN